MKDFKAVSASANSDVIVDDGSDDDSEASNKNESNLKKSCSSDNEFKDIELQDMKPSLPPAAAIAIPIDTHISESEIKLEVITVAIPIDSESNTESPINNSPNNSPANSKQIESDEALGASEPTNVEASDFATKLLSLYGITTSFTTIDQTDIEEVVCFSSSLSYEDLRKITFSDIRGQIFDLLVKKELISPELSPEYIRCFKCVNNNSVVPIYSTATLHDNGIYIVSALEHIAVEILTPEQKDLEAMIVPEYLKYGFVTIKRFCRKTWSITEQIQILYEKAVDVIDIQRYVANYFKISTEDVVFNRIFWTSEEQKISLYEMRNKDWFKIDNQMKSTSALGSFEVIYVSDSSENYGDLSPADIASIKINEASKDYAYSYNTINKWWDKNFKKSSSSSSVSSTATSSATTFTKKAAAGGVSIKRKGEKSKATGTAEATVTATASDNNTTTSSASAAETGVGGWPADQSTIVLWAIDP